MKTQMIGIATLIILLLYVPEAHGKALAVRYIQKVEEEMERKVYARSGNVYWQHRSDGLTPDNSEWGDMMWEIDDRYMKEVNNGNAMRVDFQINNLWEKLMGLYYSEFVRLAEENEGGEKAKEKMTKIMDRIKRKKEHEYHNMEDPEASDKEEQEKKKKEEEEKKEKEEKEKEAAEKKEKKKDKEKSRSRSRSRDRKEDGGRRRRRKTEEEVEDEEDEEMLVSTSPNLIDTRTIVSISTMALIGLILASRAIANKFSVRRSASTMHEKLLSVE